MAATLSDTTGSLSTASDAGPSRLGMATGVPVGTALGGLINWRASFLVLAHFALFTYIAPVIREAGLPDSAGPRRVGCRS